MKPVLLIIWGAIAASGIEIPSIGMIVDTSGDLRPVQGVAGNFLLGPVTVSGAFSAACSEHLCLIKTDSKILSETGEADAPPGPAVFDIKSDNAVVFFPDSRMFALWHDNALAPLDWTVEGEVLSIRGTDSAVRRDGQTWIVRSDGAVVDWITDTAGPVLLLEKGVLFATPDQLVLRRQDASEVRFELTGAETITAMGAHYAAIHAGGLNYAVRTDPGREGLFLLPEGVP